MLAYTLNEDAVRHAKRLIDARQYVLRSRWQNVQPRAREQNACLKTHTWEEYALWHLGLTEGAAEETKGALRVRLRRLPPTAPGGADRLPLPCHRVAAQGDRARRTRAPPVTSRASSCWKKISVAGPSHEPCGVRKLGFACNPTNPYVGLSLHTRTLPHADQTTKVQARLT